MGLTLSAVVGTQRQQQSDEKKVPLAFFDVFSSREDEDEEDEDEEDEKEDEDEEEEE